MASLSAVRLARTGEQAFVLIGGEAGVGKTCLVKEFSTGAAEAGSVVLLGRCCGAERRGAAAGPIGRHIAHAGTRVCKPKN
jgi:hypothetical protein